MAYSSVDVLKANAIIAPQVQNTSGQVFYVNNSTTVAPGAIGGSDSNDGKSPLTPFSTIDYAIGQCTASRGDIVYACAGHSEAITAANGIDLDVAGVQVIGLGNGRNRAALTYTTAAGATFRFNAANCALRNFYITGIGVASVTKMFNVNAADCQLTDCEIVMTDATNQAVRGVVLTASTAGRFKFLRNTVRANNAGPASAIELLGTNDGVEIGYNHIEGDFSVANIENPVGNINTNAKVHHNYLKNIDATNPGLEFVSATTGVIEYNTIITDAIGTSIDPGLSATFQNYWWLLGDTTDESGTIVPVTGITDSLANILGADSANNVFASTNVVANEDGSIIERLEQIQKVTGKGTGTAVAANKSLVDALGTDGTTVTDAAANVLGAIGPDNANNAFASTNIVANEDGSVMERLEQLQKAVNKGAGTAIGAAKSLVDAIGFDGVTTVAASAGMLRVAAGTEFVVTKILTSSAVTQAGVAVTLASTGGTAYLKEWCLRGAATGLATGTNFTLEVNNVNGSAVFCSHAVASLGANTLVDRHGATTGKQVVVESGKVITAKCTVADCTGAGTLAVDMLFVRGADNVAIAAA